MAKTQGTTGRRSRVGKIPRLATGDAKAAAKLEPVLEKIHRLSERQHRLYGQETLSHADLEDLAYTNLEWEQCWELWCQDQALLYAGEKPVQPRLRPAKVAMKSSKTAAVPRPTVGT